MKSTKLRSANPSGHTAPEETQRRKTRCQVHPPTNKTVRNETNRRTNKVQKSKAVRHSGPKFKISERNLSSNVRTTNRFSHSTLKKCKSDSDIIRSLSEDRNSGSHSVSISENKQCNRTLNLNVSGFIEVRTSEGTLSQIGGLESVLPEILKRMMVGNGRRNLSENDRKTEFEMSQKFDTSSQTINTINPSEEPAGSDRGDRQQSIPTRVSGVEKWPAGTEDYESRQFMPEADAALANSELETWAWAQTGGHVDYSPFPCNVELHGTQTFPHTIAVHSEDQGGLVAFQEWENYFTAPEEFQSEFNSYCNTGLEC